MAERLYRFFCPFIDSHASVVIITDKNELHHLKNVLRLGPHDQIKVFDGEGKEILGTILSFENRGVLVKIDEWQSTQNKSFFLTLACAIPKKAKFETIIEKTTELGIDEIIPLKTQRTEVLYKGTDVAKKNIRFQTVAINAAKQSRRKTIPKIHPPMEFHKVLQDITTYDLALISHLAGERQTLKEAFLKLKTKPKNTIFFIGPEGDFTKHEVQLALAAGCIPLSLGPTVLKVDTAAIAVVSFFNLFWHEHQ